VREPSRENAPRAHVTLFKPPEGPPPFAVKSINTLSEHAANVAKKRPQSAMKIKNLSKQVSLP
jgi:hypothetical protein